ncbi:uL1 family ribosomal protein [Candidatus Vidania fulgoroideorum]
MLKKTENILTKIKEKKCNFNETIELNYILSDLKFKISSFIVLPYGTKRNIKIISFFSDEIKYNLSKNFSDYSYYIKTNSDFCVIKKKILKYNYIFCDINSFIYLKKNNIISFILKKKKKLDLCYGNVSDSLINLKLMKEGKLIFFEIKNNKLNLPFGSINMKSNKILNNFLYINNYVKNISNFNKFNLVKLLIKSTHGVIYKIF